MNHRLSHLLLAGILFCFGTSVKAQDSLRQANKKPSVAILLPLYLDSAYDAAGNYRYGKEFPKFMSPGLEFYEGVQMAIDSLKKEKVALDVHIIDTRSAGNIQQIIQKPDVKDADLVLAHISNNELRPLAEFANREKVPFINVNIPNDGGVTNNPYMVILNSTLASHCVAMYKFLQRNYSGTRIIVFRKAGAQEDKLKGCLEDVAKTSTGSLVQLKYITLPSSFQEGQLTPYLDSSRTNLVVAGSLDENFAKQLAMQLASLNSTYPVKIMGMPTWDGIRDFDKKVYKDLEILYTTSFNPDRSDPLSMAIIAHYKDNLYSRPSDMVFRGYETMYRFGKLLRDQKVNIASSLGEKKYKVFTDFDIQPVLLDRQKQQLDYFENKKFYINRKLNGVVTVVN